MNFKSEIIVKRQRSCLNCIKWLLWTGRLSERTSYYNVAIIKMDEEPRKSMNEAYGRASNKILQRHHTECSSMEYGNVNMQVTSIAGIHISFVDLLLQTEWNTFNLLMHTQTR